ncbi:quinone oxidoreductase family protein [Brachybacterium hainanense]|uniref:Zinc-binding alcohol dehydrogenase family protein n=1 Tax=Brachybacterium hainanense TaxID=1541174 RepID=A0ABV6R9M1_9MICO
MRALIVDQLGTPPVCRRMPDPQPAPGRVLAQVRAAAVKNVDRMLAAGTHYASSRLDLPARLGTDAVVELPDGTRAFTGVQPPEGAFAEQITVDPAQLLPLPATVEDAAAAALPNAGVSAWLALEHSARVRPGATVLVLGATGVTGSLAVQLARRRFRAGRVIAAGRSRERLHRLAGQGADATVRIGEDPAQLRTDVAALHAERPIDVVLDLLWGPPAEQVLQALGGDDLGAPAHRTRYVQIGESAGPQLRLPAAVLRSTGLELVGQGGGSVPAATLARVPTEILPALFDLLARGDLQIDTISRPLAQGAVAWTAPTPSGTRMVLVP